MCQCVIWHWFCLYLIADHGLSCKLWYLQYHCVGDTMIYYWDSDVPVCDMALVLLLFNY